MQHNSVIVALNNLEFTNFLWCEDASNISGNECSFIRINQEFFEKYFFKSIKELVHYQKIIYKNVD